jgi:HSP20 family protein
MLMRIVPARDFHRSAHHGARDLPATWSHPAPIPLDAERGPAGFVFRLDLPGVPAEAIEIQTSGTTLAVRAERRPADHEPTREALLTERKLGVFARQITLDHTAALDRAEATLDAGVLTITVPIAAEPTVRTIPITHS